MNVSVTNAQRALPIDTGAVARLARHAITRLRITTPGTLAITFLDPRQMRTLNKRFLRHDRLTDVISFRYQGESIAGEVFVAPSAAHRYAQQHGLTYREELSRYVVHGLLHWLGHDDHTAAQQRRMRALEDAVLASCNGTVS